jgi:hypothetical protein
MDTARHLLAAALVAAMPALGWAQGFSADYDLARSGATEAPLRVAPAFAMGGEALGAGLTLQTGPNWFGQVGLSQATLNQLTHATNDSVNLGGGYRFSAGQALSLQVSRARGPLPRLGLSVGYDWPRYFLRFTYDQGLNLTPADSLRFSAGVRF